MKAAMIWLIIAHDRASRLLPISVATDHFADADEMSLRAIRSSSRMRSTST